MLDGNCEGVTTVKDMYFVECSECGNQANVVLDEPPTENTKVVCDSCKEKDDEDFLSW